MLDMKMASRTQVLDQAHGFCAFRELSNGEGRSYTSSVFTNDSPQNCEDFLRMSQKLGWITDADGLYGVLDVLDAGGNILQDFTIPDSSSFRCLVQELHLKAEKVAEDPLIPRLISTL